MSLALSTVKFELNHVDALHMVFYFVKERLVIINISTKQRDYDIVLEHGAINRVNNYIEENSHVFIVSDSGVPEIWKDKLTSQFPNSTLHVVEQGEHNKNMESLQGILADMLDHKVSRRDTLIALGGGVVGDMGGFAAACYMRGIKFINIPTTLLSQIDSSIGGKTAIDFGGVKNSVGAFWQPSLVIIDPDVLTTLDERQVNCGIAEAIKTGLIGDESLFKIFEADDFREKIDIIIEKCLRFKKKIVELDENETGLRKLLNFGHTYGHAFESYAGGKYFHGECVAMGMMTILNNAEIKARLESVLKRVKLPTECDYDKSEIVRLVKNDKKADHAKVTIVQVDKIGEGHLEDWSVEQIEGRLS